MVDINKVKFGLPRPETGLVMSHSEHLMPLMFEQGPFNVGVTSDILIAAEKPCRLSSDTDAKLWDVQYGEEQVSLKFDKLDSFKKSQC